MQSTSFLSLGTTNPETTLRCSVNHRTAGPRARPASHHFPRFRERDKHKELHGEWASPGQVLSARDRIERAEEEVQEAIVISRQEWFSSDYSRKFAGAQVPIYPEKTGETVAAWAPAPRGPPPRGNRRRPGTI